MLRMIIPSPPGRSSPTSRATSGPPLRVRPATRQGFVRFACDRHIASIEMEDAMKAPRIASTLILMLALAIPAMAQIKLTDTDTTKLFLTVNTVGTATPLVTKDLY